MGILLIIAAVAVLGGFQLGRSYERKHPKKEKPPRLLSVRNLFGVRSK